MSKSGLKLDRLRFQASPCDQAANRLIVITAGYFHEIDHMDTGFTCHHDDGYDDRGLRCLLEMEQSCYGEECFLPVGSVYPGPTARIEGGGYSCFAPAQ